MSMHETSSTPEDLFAELFIQVAGPGKATYLVAQYAFDDIDGSSRFVDFALRTIDHPVAFEIDGLTWHVPDVERIGKYEDDLLRQNSLMYLGWQVFRWTDRQISQEPERVKEQLALFLERIPGLLDFDDFLPRQRGEVFQLRGHQAEALAALREMRTQQKTIALLTHAQGAGKTVTAITDAKEQGGRTLFVVHTRELAQQAHAKFEELWPGVDTGLFVGQSRESETHNVVATVQSLSKNVSDFPPEAFRYLIIDEAHHATSETYQRILKYFRPQFTLGLTATPDRADGQSALEVFRTAAHRLDLRQAVACGELVPIRCVRVRTNIDLSKVRFNQVQYNRRDIEETVMVPGRDRLIVDTYRDHVPGRKAVAFCVNVRHGEELARRFTESGFPARCVSGRMQTHKRREAFEQFARGDLKVLCAADLLNEGWDCPEVEVLLMARPTLSRVIYLQQLGRGTRKAPGKESLVVFDFVDNASRYNQSLSLHRVMGQPGYKPGALVLAPELMLHGEQSLPGGTDVDAAGLVLPVELWARGYEEIDVFDWQDAVKGMISAADLELKLATSAGRVKSAVERGVIQADHTLTLGERVYHYFKAERVESVRVALGLPEISEKTLRGRFLAYVQEMDMASSYKPVMLDRLLYHADSLGRVRIDVLVRDFQAFYLDRLARGEHAEGRGARMTRADSLTHEEVRAVMLGMPFEKFERRGFLGYDPQDLAYLRLEPRLRRQLTDADFQALRATCHQAIEQYYARLNRS